MLGIHLRTGRHFRKVLGAVSLCLLAATTLSACKGRQRDPGERTVVSDKKKFVAVVNLSAGAPENPVSDGFFPQPMGEGFVGLIRSLHKLRDDQNVRGFGVT